MSSPNIGQLYENILTAVHLKDIELLKQYSWDIEEMSLGVKEYNPECFALLIKLFNDASFLKLGPVNTTNHIYAILRIWN